MNLRSTLTTLFLLVALLPVTQAANRVLEIKSAADYVTIPDSDSLHRINVFTLEAWVNVPVFRKDSAIIAKRRNEAGTSFALRVGTGDLGQYAVLGMNNDFGDGTGVNFVMTAGQLVAGRWHHLAATYDGQTASIFIDGNLASSEKIAMRLRPSSFPLTIGQENLPGDPRAFLGLIDEVRVWNRALSAQEIRSRMSMQLTGEEPGLVGYWNFDDQTAKDRSP
ncbi:MAG: LamG domain-containing protein, partial [Verrucomicrobia bacterium]|nr:LamG domain-containing protein [Verrucomicrobiota bacterium]